MRVIYHNWSATKQRPHPQSVAQISRHSVLSGDRIRQCETSSGSRHKDTDQCLSVAISFCRHHSVPVPCENGSAETTVAEGGPPLKAYVQYTMVTTWSYQGYSAAGDYVIVYDSYIISFIIVYNEPHLYPPIYYNKGSCSCSCCLSSSSSSGGNNCCHSCKYL